MARLSKERLMGLVREAVGSGGWTVTPLSGPKDHPYRFEMAKGGERHNVRAYIWNMTHGGGAKRPRDEFRIQITKVEQFAPEPGGITLILGWSDDFGVFAAFDIAHHSGLLGKSPSIQIGRAALDAARRGGIAVQEKDNREVAVAARADHLARYVVNRDQAHRGDLNGLALPDHEIDFNALIRAGQPLNLGSAAELAQRNTVLDRLAALEREIEAIKPQVGLMGHNRPPETLESDLDDAAATLNREMSADNPNPDAIGKSASVLQRIWKTLRSARDAGRRFVDEVTEKARERVAETVVGVAFGATALYGPQIVDAIASVLSAIGHWFRLIL